MRLVAARAACALAPFILLACDRQGPVVDETARVSDPPPLGAEVILAQAPGETPADCIDLARDQTLLDDERSIELCSFAMGTAPVACFLSAQASTLLTVEESIVLCRCARSAAPVDCYVRVDDTTLLDRQRILALCKATTVLRLYPNCTPIDFWPVPPPATP